MARVVIGETELGAIYLTEYTGTHYAEFCHVLSGGFELYSNPHQLGYAHLIKDKKGNIQLFTFAEFKELYPLGDNIVSKYKNV